MSADTSFDDNISPASLAGIKLGDILEVSGMPASDGTLHATRIERKPVGTGLQVIGTCLLDEPDGKDSPYQCAGRGFLGGGAR